MSDSPLTSPLVVGLAAASLAALAVRAFLVEPSRIEVTRHDLPVPDLPPPWEGARVVHITDLHYGNPRSEYLFRDTVDRVNALEPDLVLVTGDYLVRTAREVGPCAGHLARLRAKHGVVGVLGDHDFDRTRRPITGLCAALQEAGIRLLRNEGVELPGGLRIAGTDPNTAKVNQADLRKAVQSLAQPPHILLAHSPDIISTACVRGIPVVLCGHTHGGQVVVPFYGPPITHTRVGRRHASGWSELKGTRMYTNRGIGSHFSLRFLCPPEIAVFTLARGKDALTPPKE
jgi:uncharacterized protein